MMTMKNKKDIDNNNKKAYRILLVDDEPDITLSLNKVLKNNGFAMDAFNNPLLTLSSFKQGLYALTLIDFGLPKMNGFELYNEINKIDNKVKVCFITASDNQNEDLKAAIPDLNAAKCYYQKNQLKCMN